MTATVGSTVEDAPASAAFRYLPAIDGLRAVAILLVVLNHADVPGFGGGFVGVDMFFAISGFLITGRMVRSMSDGRGQPLAEFWAGRARRILPAMAAVVVVTCVATAFVMGPDELSRIAGYGLSSVLLVVNYLIAYKGGNYFDGPLREMPFLHLWSLAVEEQFYVVWPLFLGPFARGVAKVVRANFRTVLAWALGLSSMASLVVSVWLTRADEQWAFYSLPTRVYEFALGAAAALFWVGKLPERARVATTVGGIAALVAGVALTPEGAGFPSAWPLLSAGGTVLLILGTAPPTSGAAPVVARWVSAALSCRPMRTVGRYSYGWYLWHWPALVLGTIAWSVTWGRVASFASFGLAVASFHVVEQPVRYLPTLVRSNVRSLAAGVAFLLIGAAACAGMAFYGHERLKDPEVAELVASQEAYAPAGCTSDVATFGIEVCMGGTSDAGAPIVLLVGDSHAGQWEASFARAGKAGGFKVALRQFGNCSPYPYGRPNTLQDPECVAYQNDTVTLFDRPEVKAVVFAEATTSRKVHGTPREWYDDAVATIGRIPVPVGLIVDQPAFNSPQQCMLRGASADECTPSRTDAYAPLRPFSALESQLEDHHVTVLDVNERVCPGTRCALKTSDGQWIPARANHLNRDFTYRLVGPIGTFVDTVLHSVPADRN